MADFFKYWYTIEETVKILNDHFNYLKKIRYEEFKIKDILNFYQEERIRLALHIQELDNYKPIINLFNKQIPIGSMLYDFFDDEEIKGDIQIRSGESIISLDDDYLYAKGYFSLPITHTSFDGVNFSIYAIKIYFDDQIDVTAGERVDYEFSLNHSFSIAFPAPIEISKDDIIILRSDILDLISMLEENQHAKTYLENNRKSKILESSELSQQLTAKDEEIARLKAEIEQLKQAQPTSSPQTEEDKQGRTSQAQRALFALLLKFLYPDGKIPNTNSIKTAIDSELEKIGYPNGIAYNTITKLLNK